MALEYLTWWLMSPGVACFLFLNVLVAAIAVTSRSRAQQGDGAVRRRRAGSSAAARRPWSSTASGLRSFSAAMFSTHPSVELCYYVSPEAEEAIPMSENAEDESAAAGMVVKSTSSDGDALGQDGGGHAQEPMPSPLPAAAAPAVAVVTAETARAALLVRGPPKEEEPAVVAAAFVKRKQSCRDHVYAVEAKAELNARAEQFIRQFWQELKLQRLDSLLSRHAHTLGTGSGAPAKPFEQRD